MTSSLLTKLPLSPATHFYASQAIPLAGLPTPKIFITAESVKQGKPKPDPYRAFPPSRACSPHLPLS